MLYNLKSMKKWLHVIKLFFTFVSKMIYIRIVKEREGVVGAGPEFENETLNHNNGNCSGS